LTVKILLNPNPGMYTHLLLFDFCTSQYCFFYLLYLINQGGLAVILLRTFGETFLLGSNMNF
jgi:hypothetical protein